MSSKALRCLVLMNICETFRFGDCEHLSVCARMLAYGVNEACVQLRCECVCIRSCTANHSPVQSSFAYAVVLAVVRKKLCFVFLSGIGNC